MKRFNIFIVLILLTLSNVFAVFSGTEERVVVNARVFSKPNPSYVFKLPDEETLVLLNERFSNSEDIEMSVSVIQTNLSKYSGKIALDVIPSPFSDGAITSEEPKITSIIMKTNIVPVSVSDNRLVLEYSKQKSVGPCEIAIFKIKWKVDNNLNSVFSHAEISLMCTSF